ncbi:cysteinyl-tRNA synthetase [Candidatus Omnitrophus magneticus]|uniref:Cysteine--tRNA ligase n=1 Tax=Candidatus Omnitrophus magneticus TaxID=1609969 RepID=A0A0F0CQ52_9BACT|nr:cysteinyl-tRNA synthetase [Candidatus Omnitrophus magneticus]
MIKIYNTLTRKKEDFKPISEKKIKMYVCGPTVYDLPHIGHARSAYVFDVIRRYLEHKSFNVILARNVTDVDDKIIARALKEIGKNNEHINEEEIKEASGVISIKYLKAYHEDMAKLGIKPPTFEPKATENIDEMIRFIEILIAKGFAYSSHGNVYFSVDQFPSYGRLSNQKKEEMLTGARIEVDPLKKYSLDFALWKASKDNEPAWLSPWGMGRPGWHIECSVMSIKILGNNFDIHGGGLDLIFPHHENEIAQAEAVTGEVFANYWMHHGLLTVNGEKMSKSLGNYITLSDFLSEHNDADLLKLLFLSSHYRSSVDYTAGKIDEKRKEKERFIIFFDKVNRLSTKALGANNENSAALKEVQSKLDSLLENFYSAMDDDFNTPLALSVLFSALHLGNDCFEKISGDNEKFLAVKTVKFFIEELSGLFGIKFQSSDSVISGVNAEEINNLIEERTRARSEKNYKLADDIRKKLVDKRIVIEDTPGGTIWRKI